MSFLNRQELIRIQAQDGRERFVHIRPDENAPLIFRLFNTIPGIFFLNEPIKPPGYINLDDLPDEESPSYQGRILFDNKGNWVYDGGHLTIAEQEQLAAFIKHGDAGTQA